MNIKELKATTIVLSDTIQNMIEKFESETGTTVAGIDLNRIDISTINAPATLLNVNLKVEI